uniref:Uncharacterized protein n=1 Tax=Romanomermis culicivorax TaxID=13658 RepID=A0A915KGX0_ROMCU
MFPPGNEIFFELNAEFLSQTLSGLDNLLLNMRKLIFPKETALHTYLDTSIDSCAGKKKQDRESSKEERKNDVKKEQKKKNQENEKRER